MSNVLLAANNWADVATLSAGSWSSTLPLNNLKDYRLGKKARTTDATVANTKLRFALASTAQIGVVGLVSINASIAATYRVKLFSDAGFSVLVYDSGTLDLYPSGTIPAGETPWGAPTIWDGKPTLPMVTRFQRNLVHVPSAPQFAQYGEIQITDTTNPAGYFEAGRLLLGQTWRPTINASSLSYQLTSRTNLSRALDGTPYFTPERPDFCVPFAVASLSETEAMFMLDLQALVDVYGEVLFVWDSDSLTHSFRKRVFGRLKTIDPIEYATYAVFKTAFQVEGQL